MDGVVLGEGWGCAHGALPGDGWQCWEAGPRPQAFTVPWLRGGLRFAPDWICELATPELAFRCWQRPRAGDVGPRELPASWEWLNPHHAAGTTRTSAAIGWAASRWRDLRLPPVHEERRGVLPRRRSLRPAGLQLGSGPGRRPPRSRVRSRAVAGDVPDRRDLARVRAGGPARDGAGGHTACWGRGDAGQLGAPAPDTCTVDGQAIACARHPVRGPALPGMSVVKAGDLFTCVTTRGGISCWGASRDGFFGVPGSVRRACVAPGRRWPAPSRRPRLPARRRPSPSRASADSNRTSPPSRAASVSAAGGRLHRRPRRHAARRRCPRRGRARAATRARAGSATGAPSSAGVSVIRRPGPLTAR